jgi:gamma-glutamyltranspeptidase / glutathione hydrolase
LPTLDYWLLCLACKVDIFLRQIQCITLEQRQVFLPPSPKERALWPQLTAVVIPYSSGSRLHRFPIPKENFSDSLVRGFLALVMGTVPSSGASKAIFLFAFSVFSMALPLRSASRPPVRGKIGMVVSADPLASKVGLEILKKGGNAVDAAVAVGFALAVTYPAAGNLGGGGFMMIRLNHGETICIDYRERAPLASREDIYLDRLGAVLPKASTEGYRASGVPGTVAGLCLASSKYGRLPLREVIQPAIALAETGFPVSYQLSESLKRSAGLLQAFSESARIYLRDGRYFEPDEVLVLTDLAWSLKTIRDLGPEGFYRGPIARKLVEHFKTHGGWITQEDLTTYQPVIRTPVIGNYRGYGIITVPPPSSGGIVLLEMLNILEGYPLKDYGAGSSQWVHLATEAMKLAFRDRSELMGDPDFVTLPVETLTSKTYAGTLRKTIHLDRASSSQTLPKRVLLSESQETTHYSIVDQDGNAVANTYTLNGGYGSGVTVPGSGILMNNEMDDFTSKVDVPNAYGLIQGKANAIVPGKRPLSAMTPTFVTHGKNLVLVIGSPGGPTIINTVLQVVVDVIDFGFTIQEAIDAPRFHHQYLPDELRLEKRGWAQDVVAALQSRGHKTVLGGFIGDAQGIQFDPQTGILGGASDPRGDGLALGY